MIDIIFMGENGMPMVGKAVMSVGRCARTVVLLDQRFAGG